MKIEIVHRYDNVVMGALKQLMKGQRLMADKFDVLVAEVAAVRSVADGVVLLLVKLDERLADAKDDPEQIEAIRTELAAERQRLADAVVAHTPADVPPVEPPAEPVE